MSNENLQYIYDSEENYEASSDGEHYSGPIPMGKEREYLSRKNKELKDFLELQLNADIEAEQKKKVDTSPQLFGISNQHNSLRVSLDEQFPGDMLYKITADNMSPYIPPKTVVLLQFCHQHASGEVCVYRYKGRTYCNQIKVIDKQIIALSFNPKYKPIRLDPDEYILIAVVSSIHRSLKSI